MADRKVSSLAVMAAGDLDPVNDRLLVSDTSAGASKAMAPSEMIRAALPYLTTAWDFTTGVLSPTVSFTRASTGWRWNSSGVLVPESTDAARFQYGPATLAPRGLLIEQAATNVIRNSSAVGAVPGVPGTVPTNWSISTSVDGLTREIVGTGTEDGIPYIDVRFSGTPSASSTLSLIPETYTLVPAVLGQVWSGAFFLRLVAGSWTNVGSGGVGHYLTERDSGGTTLVSTSATIVPTSAALRTQRAVLTRTFSNASVARVTTSLGVGYTSGSAIDFTLRVGLPQLVQSNLIGSPIITTGSAAARAADTPLITNPQALADQCYIIKARTAPALPMGSDVQMLFCADNGSTAFRRCAWRNSAGAVYVVATVDGVQVLNLYVGTVANDTDFSLAVRYADANTAASLNGGAIVTDLVALMPVGLTTVRIGHDLAGRSCNSPIKTFETRRTATNAEAPLLAA